MGKARETRIETTGRIAGVVLEIFLELAARDAEVAFDQIVDRETGVVVQLLRDSLFVALAEVSALGERLSVGAHGEVFDFFQECLEIGVLLRQLVMVTSGGSIGGQRQLIR